MLNSIIDYGDVVIGAGRTHFSGQRGPKEDDYGLPVPAALGGNARFTHGPRRGVLGTA
jgi:hypothetical protein